MEAAALLVGGGMGISGGLSQRTADSQVRDYENVVFGEDELETDRAQLQSSNLYLLKELSLANKKIAKVKEYIGSLHLDLREGTLKRVAPTLHPVQRLDLDAISEDSDEQRAESKEDKSIMNSSIDTEFKGMTSTTSKAHQKRRTKSEREKPH